MNIAKRIKELRTKNNYTQEQLASICKVSRQAVAKWESGANLPDIEKILLLSKLFHVSTDELLNGKRNQTLYSDGPALRSSYAENEKIINNALKEAMLYDDPNEEINQFLSLIGGQIGYDRICIFESNSNGNYANTYEWCKKGVTPQMEYLQNIPREDISGWLNAFTRGGHIFIKDIEEKAVTDPDIYKWLKPQHIQSLLVYSLFGGRAFISVDNPAPAFITQTSSLIELMVHFVETMLQRRELMQKLKWVSFQNDQFNQITKGVRYQLNLITGKLQYDLCKLKESGYNFKAKTFSELKKNLSSHPEFYDHVMIDGLQKAIDTKENVSVEFISYKEDRQVRWNRLSISPFLDSRGMVVQLYGMLQDISDQHQLTEQYNKYISHLSGGLHICYLSRPIHLDYSSDDLCDFLGYSRDEFNQIVGNIYTNIMVEEDRPVFAAYAQKLAAAPGIATCEYRLIKKDGSTVCVIDTMESVMDSDGIMYGYAHVLDKSQLHIMLDMAEDNEKRHLAIINDQYAVLETLGKDYLNVFRVWLDEDKGQILSLKGYVTKGMDKKSAEYIPYYRFCKQYIQDRVYPDDQQKMLTAMHPDTVRKAFSEDDEYIVVYRALENGEAHFYQLKYIRLNGPEDFGKFNFVAGFKNIDKVMQEEHAKNEQLQSRLNIINAILQAFACGYFYTFETDSYIELANSEERMSKLIGKEGNFTENRKLMRILFPDKEAFRAIDDFLDVDTLETRLSGQRYLSSQVFLNGYGWYELYMIVVDYDAQGKLSHCIFAARNINSEKQREEEYIRSLGIANNREKMAMQFAYLDSLTGVMNRNAFERDFSELDAYTNIGFVFCDVNNLKITNDTLGHTQGDLLLTNFSTLIKQHFSVDCIYRIGGDEFVCMIGNIEKEPFEQRVKAFIDEITLKGNIAAVGCAYGNTKAKAELLREAEVKMYAMKALKNAKKMKTAI